MRRLFKWILRLVLLLVTLVVLLFVFKDTILRAVVEHRINKRTGLEVKIGKISSRLFSQTYTLENVMVYNPAEFGGTPFLNVAELHIEVDPADLTRREVRVTLARLRLTELDVVRNEAGQTNLFTVADRVKKRTKKIGGWHKVLGDFQFTGIDTLNLSIGKIRYLDLKEPRNSRETALNLQDQVFRKLYTKTDLEANLIKLWLAGGGKWPFTLNDIVNRFINRRDTQAEYTRPPPRRTNAPPRL